MTPQGTGYQRGGAKSETSNFVREINQEWTLGVDKEFGKIRVNAFVGGNKMVNEAENIKRQLVLTSTYHSLHQSTIPNHRLLAMVIVKQELTHFMVLLK